MDYKELNRFFDMVEKRDKKLRERIETAVIPSDGQQNRNSGNNKGKDIDNACK